MRHANQPALRRFAEQIPRWLAELERPHTPEELAAAEARLAMPRTERQPALPLKPTPDTP